MKQQQHQQIISPLSHFGNTQLNKSPSANFQQAHPSYQQQNQHIPLQQQQKQQKYQQAPSLCKNNQNDPIIVSSYPQQLKHREPSNHVSSEEGDEEFNYKHQINIEDCIKEEDEEGFSKIGSYLTTEQNQQNQNNQQQIQNNANQNIQLMNQL
eukprot:403341358